MPRGIGGDRSLRVTRILTVNVTLHPDPKEFAGALAVTLADLLELLPRGYEPRRSVDLVLLTINVKRGAGFLRGRYAPPPLLIQ